VLDHFGPAPYTHTLVLTLRFTDPSRYKLFGVQTLSVYRLFGTKNYRASSVQTSPVGKTTNLLFFWRRTKRYFYVTIIASHIPFFHTSLLYFHLPLGPSIILTFIHHTHYIPMFHRPHPFQTILLT